MLSDPEQDRDLRLTKRQRITKARFHDALAQREAMGLTDMAAIDQDTLVSMTGTRHVLQWVQDPTFAAWFFDRDVFKHRVAALRETALERIEDVLNGELEERVLTAKDRLRAAELLLQLADAFPAKQKIVKWLDKELGDLEDSEVKRQLADYQRKLALKST
jgi:hypothetical protein